MDGIDEGFADAFRAAVLMLIIEVRPAIRRDDQHFELAPQAVHLAHRVGVGGNDARHAQRGHFAGDNVNIRLRESDANMIGNGFVNTGACRIAFTDYCASEVNTDIETAATDLGAGMESLAAIRRYALHRHDLAFAIEDRDQQICIFTFAAVLRDALLREIGVVTIKRLGIFPSALGLKASLGVFEHHLFFTLDLLSRQFLFERRRHARYLTAGQAFYGFGARATLNILHKIDDITVSATAKAMIAIVIDCETWCFFFVERTNAFPFPPRALEIYDVSHHGGNGMLPANRREVICHQPSCALER